MPRSRIIARQMRFQRKAKPGNGLAEAPACGGVIVGKQREHFPQGYKLFRTGRICVARAGTTPFITALRQRFPDE
jgi:hypothetical protein